MPESYRKEIQVNGKPTATKSDKFNTNVGYLVGRGVNRLERQYLLPSKYEAISLK